MAERRGFWGRLFGRGPYRGKKRPNAWMVVRPRSEGFYRLGSVMPARAARRFLPDQVHLCDGSELSKEEYPELAGLLGGVYGETETTFRLPILRTVQWPE